MHIRAVASACHPLRIHRRNDACRKGMVAETRRIKSCRGRRLCLRLADTADLECGFFHDSLLSAVVAAFAADGVVNRPCSAVGAQCQGGSNGFVVGATFCSTGLGLFAFGMCHC